MQLNFGLPVYFGAYSVPSGIKCVFFSVIAGPCLFATQRAI